MNYSLQKSITINNEEIPIRTDYRVVLDAFEMLEDPELTDADKLEGLIGILIIDTDTFYALDVEKQKEALQQLLSFLNGGKTEGSKTKKRKLVSWSFDFPYIVAAVNRIVGYDIREVDYLHWWTFLAAYLEISGKSVFSQIVAIRDKIARGKLERWEQEWYQRNIDIVNIPTKYTEAEKELLKEWGASP